MFWGDHSVYVCAAFLLVHINLWVTVILKSQAMCAMSVLYRTLKPLETLETRAV